MSTTRLRRQLEEEQQTLLAEEKGIQLRPIRVKINSSPIFRTSTNSKSLLENIDACITILEKKVGYEKLKQQKKRYYLSIAYNMLIIAICAGESAAAFALMLFIMNEVNKQLVFPLQKKLNELLPQLNKLTEDNKELKEAVKKLEYTKSQELLDKWHSHQIINGYVDSCNDWHNADGKEQTIEEIIDPTCGEFFNWDACVFTKTNPSPTVKCQPHPIEYCQELAEEWCYLKNHPEPEDPSKAVFIANDKRMIAENDKEIARMNDEIANLQFEINQQERKPEPWSTGVFVISATLFVGLLAYVAVIISKSRKTHHAEVSRGKNVDYCINDPQEAMLIINTCDRLGINGSRFQDMTVNELLTVLKNERINELKKFAPKANAFLSMKKSTNSSVLRFFVVDGSTGRSMMKQIFTEAEVLAKPKQIK